MDGAAVGARRAVWIDLRCMPEQRGLLPDARPHCEPLRITQLTEIPRAVAAHRPQFVCIEYDYPDRARLAAVPLVRREFPALPVLMFTEYHSEALAMWAFRSRVWDYRVKPIAAETIARQIEAVALTAAETTATHGWPAMPFPRDLIAPAGHLRRPLSAAPRTAAAVAWISEHYAEPCRIGAIAALCHLSESEFSRVFHREHGTSFRRFLVHYRIDKARDFLTEPQASVSQVAYAVGFNDLSQFGRMFRRIVGIPATRFQQQSLPRTQPP
ncbi:MAG: helix-turn-helix domain-containing protein [Proteobacteria bacterium]|nr:helix-turn-helix domain-containing protein [Pseudomonadota bacterium]